MITTNFVNLILRSTFGKGLMMLIDIPEERGGSILDIRFGRPTNCFFPLLPFVKPMSASKMGIVYACLWLG